MRTPPILINFNDAANKNPLAEPDRSLDQGSRGGYSNGCTDTEYSTMYHELPRGVSFWLFLLAVDQDLAQTTRQKACSCGGRLHCANYPRKPRGADALPADYAWRFSFCCARDGCRQRVTPPSVRFRGRKVYLFAVVVLVSAMRQGPSPRRVRELSQ